MKRRILVLLSFLLLAVVVTVVTATVVIKEEFGRRLDLPAAAVVEIQPGENLKQIAARMQAAGLVGSERVFRWAAAWKGSDRTIKHGRHEFRGVVTLSSVLAELARPPKPILRVTIPEGLTLREIGALLERAGATSAAAYQAVACSEELRRLVAAPPTAACAEGFLFPDTYDLLPGMSPGAIVDLQVRRFHEVVDPLLAAAPTGAGPSVLPTSDPSPAARRASILTLASIVEKETAQPAERPRIAAVFFNRLKAGMLLQTDPTVIYGVIDSGLPWDGNLTRAHLTTPTPYNTYTRKGLPPGPICNPGRASIDAVLRPASTGDLYFVASGGGAHEFNDNLPAHNRAVRRFQIR